MSKERELLERISTGETVWGPTDNSLDSLERFDAEARDLMDRLDDLITAGLIGNYRAHVESYTGKRLIDRLLITEGLTSKGQDKSQWPD
jgi:hypothetical protein